MNHPPTSEEVICNALRHGIGEMLPQCTNTKVRLALWNKLHPDGIDKLDKQRLVHSYDLCRRTIISDGGYK